MGKSTTGPNHLELPLIHSPLGIPPETRACALNRNQSATSRVIGPRSNIESRRRGNEEHSWTLLLRARPTYLLHCNTWEPFGKTGSRMPPRLLNQTHDFHKVPQLVYHGPLADSQDLCGLQTWIVSGCGWSQDILKSQKGTFKTICKEGFVSAWLSLLPSAC